MAPDERDRNFDKAIARHLRSAAASGDATSGAADSLLRSASCPDAETLAAYHERSVLPAELNSWKEHLVGCAHCQELLAHLELTDEIPLQAAKEEEVVAMTDAQQAVAARTVEAQPDSARARRLAGGARWRWLVPASAIAAGLLLWISFHENQPSLLPSSSEIKVAKNQEPPAPASPVLTGVPAAAPQAQSTPSDSRRAADKLASSNSRSAPEALRPRQKTGVGAMTMTAPSKPSAAMESGSRKDEERELSTDLFRKEKQADLDANAVAGAMQQEMEVQTPARAQEQNLQVQNQINSPKAPGPAPLGQASSAKKMKAETAPPPASAAAAVSNYSVGTTAEMVMVSDSNLIAAPGSNFVWRAGRAGLIEFSPDGGHSWSRQPSGVLVDLLTGSAPSDQVCWIVGRSGAILLTTDGGAHWKMVSSPMKEDLGGIQATDALHATIWNVRSTKSFTTSDGGLTWKRVAED